MLSSLYYLEVETADNSVKTSSTLRTWKKPILTCNRTKQIPVHKIEDWGTKIGNTWLYIIKPERIMSKETIIINVINN